MSDAPMSGIGGIGGIDGIGAAGLHELLQRLAGVRAQSLALAEPLSEADCQVQSMPDASPVKWHLAHTTWFFETFVLERHEPDFAPFHPSFRVLYNSYYNGIGEQHPRPQRGLVTRPTLAEVLAYRRAVDARVEALAARPSRPAGPADAAALATLLELGLQHEQQHQELILTDVLHLLSCNPLAPAYLPAAARRVAAALPMAWCAHEGGLVEIGHGGTGFAFDNETPRHRHFLPPYALACRLVTQREWAAFVDDGGYADPRWWLSAGWDWVRAQRVDAPLYWQRDTAAASGFSSFSLHGRAPIEPEAPAVHLSFFEADAFARWWSAQHPHEPPVRLPTEAEWEHAAEGLGAAAVAQAAAQGSFVEGARLQPQAARMAQGLQQMFGEVWQWTRSSYAPYPGFQAWDGAVGEYNAKFMLDQYVLRGGSCATPRSHIRASYRNFFPACARWQFSGLRLARDLA